MERFANPARFLRLARILLPWFAGITILSLAAGLYFGLAVSPADYLQGESVRIMFVHVPSAWMSMFVYAFIAVSGAVVLVWRHPLAEVAGKAAAPIGAVFTALALFTGSLWGRPTWGTWWEWDARMTSVLVLFFIYLGYMGLWKALEDDGRAGRATAILALVGAVNLPIIKFSVDWWNTLHQPASVFRVDGPTIHPSMLLPLALMAVAAQFYFATVLIWRMRAELADRKLKALARQRALSAG
ncbi:MAG: heme ABC transporter permease [Pseudomonadota bacterium]